MLFVDRSTMLFPPPTCIVGGDIGMVFVCSSTHATVYKMSSHSINSKPLEGISSNFSQMFAALRQCAHNLKDLEGIS
jgi:hypothetical protein